MFSGQGSQYVQMGRELYIRQPLFRDCMTRMDAVVQEICGVSVVDKLYGAEASQEGFVQTLYTHPAIVMVEYAAAQVLQESGLDPDFVLGSSLGEFTAAAVSGISSIDEVLEAVIKQAGILEHRCPEGGMLAILHDPRIFGEAPQLHQYCELAAVNSSSHFVVSSESEKLAKAERFLEQQGILYQRLPVRFGYHSAAVDHAAAEYQDYLRGRFTRIPTRPIVSCVYGKLMGTPLQEGYLWKAVREPIKFAEALGDTQQKLGTGVVYVDLGPGGTLANVAKRILSGRSNEEIYAVITPFNREIENLEKIKGSVISG
ncbi:acyltransferase domain-containing protein [Paenibacillus tarimensis]|nr:acyltransferase domain-containing protein [Paenibacillus tarimensis]